MMLRKILAMALAALLCVAAVPAFDVAALAAYNMPYYIEVDLTNQVVTVYSTSTDVVVRQMLCSTGKEDCTPHGTFYLPRKKEKQEREEWYFFRLFECYAQYATRIYKGIMFHSIPCSAKSEATISKKNVAELGSPASHGCVRLRWRDAEFIAKCCLEGTRVRITAKKKRDNELRELLLRSSYTNEKGQSYKAYLGIPEAEGVMGRYSKGKDVLSLQTRLRDLGIFNDELDGEYGGSTVNAVREAQRLMEEEESGVATLEFQETIYSDDAPTAQNVTVQEGMSGPVVRNMQQYLTALRLYDDPIDGVFDVDVREAVKKFQGAYGYRTTGVLTPEIQKALYYEAGRMNALFGEDSGYDCEIASGQIYMGQVTSKAGIRLREKATVNSKALARLASGDMVVALEHGATWSRVQRGRNIGYVKNIFLDYYAQDIYALTYTSRDTGASYTIGYTARQYYDGVEIPAEVFAEYLAANGSLDSYEGINTYANVNTQDPTVSLNLRERPTTASDVLAELPDGTEVKVLLRSSEWSLVEFEDQKGYLLNQYLSFPDDRQEAEAGDAADVDADDNTMPALVRAAGGKRAPVYDVDSDDAAELGHLDNDIRVEVISTVDGWSLISYKGHTGYMRDDDLQFMMAEEVVS